MAQVLFGASGSTPLTGAYAVTVPAGVSLHCLGLVNPPVYTGTLESSTATTITDSDAAWIADTFADGSNPRYYVEITSGTLIGAILDIDSNTPTVLTILSGHGFDLANDLLATDTFIIRRHVTLGESDGLFPNGANFSAFTDSITILNLGNQPGDTYTYLDFGEEEYWSDGSGDNANDTIIRPGQAFIISSGSGFTWNVGESGPKYVKETSTRISLTQTGVNEVERVVGPINPVEITLSDINELTLQTLLGDETETIVRLTPNGNSGFSMGNAYGIVDNGGNKEFSQSPGFANPGDSETVTLSPGSAFIISISPASGDWVIPDFIP